MSFQYIPFTNLLFKFPNCGANILQIDFKLIINSDH